MQPYEPYRPRPSFMECMSFVSSSPSHVALNLLPSAACNTYAPPIPTSIIITKSDITNAPSSTDYKDNFFPANISVATDPAARVEEQKISAITASNKMLTKKQLAAFRDHVLPVQVGKALADNLTGKSNPTDVYFYSDLVFRHFIQVLIDNIGFLREPDRLSL